MKPSSIPDKLSFLAHVDCVVNRQPAKDSNSKPRHTPHRIIAHLMLLLEAASQEFKIKSQSTATKAMVYKSLAPPPQPDNHHKQLRTLFLMEISSFSQK